MGKTLTGHNTSYKIIGRHHQRNNHCLDLLKKSLSEKGSLDTTKLGKTKNPDPTIAKLASLWFDDTFPDLTHFKLDTIAYLDRINDACGVFFVESVQLASCIQKWNQLLKNGTIKRIDYQTDSGNKGEHCVRLYIENYAQFDEESRSFSYDCAINEIREFDKAQELTGIRYYLKPTVWTMLGIVANRTYGLERPYLAMYEG